MSISLVPGRAPLVAKPPCHPRSAHCVARGWEVPLLSYDDLFHAQQMQLTSSFHKRITRSQNETIANYAAVAQIVGDSRYRCFLDDAERLGAGCRTFQSTK